MSKRRGWSLAHKLTTMISAMCRALLAVLFSGGNTSADVLVSLSSAKAISPVSVKTRLTFMIRMREQACHDQTFSRDQTRDRIPCDLSPDEHLAIKNFISSHKPYCPLKVRLEMLSRFHLMRPTHTPTGHAFNRRSLSLRFLSFPFRHCSILPCFIIVISRTKTAIEYPSINLVLYSYTPNKELGSWQIVLAHLTSFL